MPAPYAFRISPHLKSDNAERLRKEVRAFLREIPFTVSDLSNGFNPKFSQALGLRGWLGLTWPRRYGGHERTGIERYVLLEELLAAGAPVAAHWIAERQSGPLLLKFGTEEQKQRYLPRIAMGELYVCIGMSEADVGSDLASIRVTALRDRDEYVINGTKLWTSHAHRSHAILLFCRTDPGARKQQGTSQLLVDLKTPGITVRPIRDLVGEAHFNEVSFTDVRVPTSSLVGVEGDGWKQVMSELDLERSGPERFFSSFPLLITAMDALKATSDARAPQLVGRLASHLAILRHLSRSVAAMIENGEDPSVVSAMVKDLGAQHEQEVPEVLRELLEVELDPRSTDVLNAMLARATMIAPSYSLRGGTREILRGIIARSLGLR